VAAQAQHVFFDAYSDRKSGLTFPEYALSFYSWPLKRNKYFLTHILIGKVA